VLRRRFRQRRRHDGAGGRGVRPGAEAAAGVGAGTRRPATRRRPAALHRPAAPQVRRRRGRCPGSAAAAVAEDRTAEIQKQNEKEDGGAADERQRIDGALPAPGVRHRHRGRAGPQDLCRPSAIHSA